MVIADVVSGDGAAREGPAGVGTTSRTSRRPPPAAGAAGRSSLTAAAGVFLVPVAAAPNRPAPFGDLSAAPVEDLVGAAERAWPAGGWPRRRSIRELAGHLARFEGDSWQQRWLASGWDSGRQQLAALNRDGGPSVTAGLRMLAALRVIAPSVTALHGTALPGYPSDFQAAARDRLLDEVFARIRLVPTSRRHQLDAENDLAYALTSQQIPLADLTPAALLHYAMASRTALQDGKNRYCGRLVWDVLHAMGHFRPDAPVTLRLALHGARHDAEGLVDQYGVANAEVRQLLVDYLRHRHAGGMDYSSLRQLARNLVRNFWVAIEQLRPGQADLHLDPDLYRAWRERISTYGTGEAQRQRTDVYGILLPVRAFYLDLQSWAVADPQRWARWVAPCPISPSATRGYATHRRRQIDRMADRTRVRQPMLPLLVEHVQASYEHARDLLALARAAEPGATVEFRGRRYQQIWTKTDQTRLTGDGHANARLRDQDTGELRNLDAAEEQAFWAWAVVAVLRLTGIRHEELLELTHLSIRQYQRPNGEVVALLVIAPSKTDRERVIPVSAELFAVLAAIIRRHTRAGHPVPAVTRWDSHEREHSPPLPFLFQRRNGARRAACSMAWVAGLLNRSCAGLAEAHPRFAGITLTPHDFRRLFATDLVNNGLPIHLGAALLGHTNLQTTRGYIAVVDEDLVRHYQTFLDRRRAQRPTEEYRPTTAAEWIEFEEHFEKRKVELGNCGRPYATPCAHEHACIRCPMLHVDPAMLTRLDELETDLVDRRARAQREGWLGEVDGIELTLRFLQQKRDQTRRIARVTAITLGPTRNR